VVITTIRRVISFKRADLSYIAAEARNHANWYLSGPIGARFKEFYYTTLFRILENSVLYTLAFIMCCIWQWPGQPHAAPLLWQCSFGTRIVSIVFEIIQYFDSVYSPAFKIKIKTQYSADRTGLCPWAKG